MGKNSLLVRKHASERLAAAWPPAAEFPAEGPPERRAAALEDLAARFRRECPAAFASHTAMSAPARPRHDPTAQEQEQIERLLTDLASADLAAQRRAADRLAELAAKTPLPAATVARLSAAAIAEPDALVWRGVLTATDDGSEPALRLAYAAVSHPAAEVRRRGCETLARRPHPRHAPVLLPALDDGDTQVVCTALRALGAGGRVADTVPIRRRLASPNATIWLTAATTLCQLGDAAGPPALERAAYHADPAIQRQAAAAIGELGDPAFTAALMHLLDGHVSVQRAALEALPAVVGQDHAAGPNLTTTERIRRWKRWYEAGHSDATAAQPARQAL
jgi:HEAT repeat protein